MGTSAYIYRVLTTYGRTPAQVEEDLNAAGGAGFTVREVLQRAGLILLERYTTLDEMVEGKKES